MPDLLEDIPDLSDMGKDALDIKRMIKERLKDFKSEEVSELATGLLKEMSEGDFKRAEDLAKNFYEGLYDN
jgi:hypothetical protein